MKFQDDLLTTLKTIKDEKDFDLVTNQIVLKGLPSLLNLPRFVDIQPVHLEANDFDKAIKLIKRNTSGKKREAAVQNWEHFKKDFIEGNVANNDLIQHFDRQLYETLTLGKTWKRREKLRIEIASVFPHLESYRKFFDLISPLIYPSVVKSIFDQSIQDFEKFDFTKVEEAIKSVQEEN